jgi:beta-phosphoglucomutase
MSEFEAVLFDFDGVLVDSEPVHFACWRDVLEPLGIKLDWQTYSRRCIGVSDRAMLEMLALQRVPPVEVEQLWAKYPVKKEMFRMRMTETLPLATEIRELLSSLHSDFKLAVVSSSGRSEVEPLLERVDLRRFLDAVICGEDVMRHKPAPEPYLLVARRLNVSRALVVEDSQAGMESARAAGFEAVQVCNPSRTAELVRARLSI